MDNQLLALIAARGANPRLQPLITKDHTKLAAKAKVKKEQFSMIQSMVIRASCTVV